MNTLYYALSLILLNLNNYSFGQIGRSCPPGTNCKLLRTCPVLMEEIRLGQPENFRRVRQSICGFEGRSSKVCCPLGGGPTGNTVTPSSAPSAGESLLPKTCGRPMTDDKIFGGSPAPIGAYPWMVAMGYTEVGRQRVEFLCSGSLINSRYVLTAGHCVNQGDLGNKRLTIVHLGDWDISTEKDCQITRLGSKCAPPHIVAGVESVLIHPEYNVGARASNDIGLIRLNISVNFNGAPGGAYVQPICLPSRGLHPKVISKGRDPLAAGWGFTERGNRSNILLRVSLPFAEDEACQREYGAQFLPNQLCVGGKGGRDTCSGDSGAPLILSGPFGPPFLQIGIVSYGNLPCALNRVPAVYTSVSEYRNWIVDNLRP